MYLDESERYGRQVGLAVLWREEGDQLTQLFRQLCGGTRTQLGRAMDTVRDELFIRTSGDVDACSVFIAVFHIRDILVSGSGSSDQYP
jgi:hypothetical protein